MLNILLAMLIMVLIVSSCVHEWPDESTPADLTLEFVFDTDLPPYDTVHYNTKTPDESMLYDLRYTVEAYKKLSDGSYDDTPLVREIFTKDDILILDCAQSISLPEGEYELRAWVDYVKQGSLDNLFYDHTDFGNITLIGDPHVASTEYRDAFVGFVQVDVVRQSSSAPNPVYRIDMERPLAKFEIIATDMVEFVTKQMELLKQKLESEQSQSDQDTKAPLEINLNDYTVRVHYNGFMPYVFSMETNKPISSRTGVFFESKIKSINSEMALLGFDYVFVNGKESSINIIIELFNKEGEKIAGTSSVQVPVIRSKLTTVIGTILTSTSNGGVGINPGFDGEDIEFPWTPYD